MKKCRGCGEILPLCEFYKHPQMADGHLNFCKSCVKDRVNKYRTDNIESARAYNRSRSHLKKRKALHAQITKKRRREVEGYESAHKTVERAVKSGKIAKPNKCQCCGNSSKLEAHHNDYSEKLSIIWLCPACHKQYHLGKTKQADKVKLFVDRFFKGAS